MNISFFLGDGEGKKGVAYLWGEGGGGDAKLALADGVTQKDGGTTPRTSMRNKIKWDVIPWETLRSIAHVTCMMWSINWSCACTQRNH